jgi:hypothetical protein
MVADRSRFSIKNCFAWVFPPHKSVLRGYDMEVDSEDYTEGDNKHDVEAHADASMA